MRRFVIQVLVNAFAVTLVLVLLPQIDIRDSNLLTMVLVGILFSLLNNLVRPLVMMLVGQLMIQTMGGFILVVNAVFALLIRFSPFDWEIAEPQWLWILVASTLISLLVTVLDALLGLDQPQLDEEGHWQSIWKWIERIPFSGSVTDDLVENMRLEQTKRVIMRYGLDIALSPTPISRIRSRVQKRISGSPSDLTGLSTPAKVRLLLQELGPTYVKFGQMVSTQVQGLPEEWEAELSQLQNTVPPFPYEEVRTAIIQELGAPPEEIFATFEQAPLAAASTAQVHRATLPTGEEVAVKVQRPNITAKVNADLRVMRKLARVLEKRLAFARQLNLSGVLEEFAIGVRKELDFDNEAFHARRLAANMTSIVGVHIPVIYAEYSSTRVLTMEFIGGVKITDTATIDVAGLDRRAIVQTVIRALVKQILIDGFFHGDPHPGNVLVDLETGVIAFLDLGLMGELSQAQRLDLLDLVWSFVHGDTQSVATVALRFTQQHGPIDERAFRADVARLYDQYWVYATGNASAEIIMNMLNSVMTRYGLRMSSELTMAGKAIAQAEAIAYTLQPEWYWLPYAMDEATTLVREQYTVEGVAEQVKSQAVRGAKGLLRELPELQDATGQWLEQFKRGRLVVDLNTDTLADSVNHFSQSMRRVTVALILIGMLIGSAIASSLLATLQDTQWAFLPIAAMGIFVGSALLSVIVVLRMLRDERTGEA